MSRFSMALGFIFSTWLVPGMILADDAKPGREMPDLGATQVTLSIENGGRQRLFQATVLSIENDVLTVLTAASLVDGNVQGRTSHLLVDGVLVEGTVVSVDRNPAHVPGRPRALPGVTAGRSPLPLDPGPTTYYYNTRLRSVAHPMHIVNRQQMAASTDSEIPGANNAIVRFRFPARPDPEKKNPVFPAFRKIRPVTALPTNSFPGASGGAVIAWMVGSDGRVHGVKASNFHNPLLLAWGHGFDPVSNDAGGGVFVLREAADGRLEPVLIGVLIGPDDRGGLASLVARGMPWVDKALTTKPDVLPNPESVQANPAPASR
jgi:hypothetical protein